MKPHSTLPDPKQSPGCKTRLELLLSGIPTPHQQRSRAAGAGERDPRAPGAGPGRGSSHTWLLHRECAPGLSGVCVLPPPAGITPLPPPPPGRPAG